MTNDAIVPELDEGIWERIQVIFAEALGLDEEEVTYFATVIDELGAESIDLLDILYQLDKEFGIKIPRGGIERVATGDESEDLDPDGALTEEALLRLKEAMPEVPASEFVTGLRPTDIPMLFRVGTFYNLVVKLLEEQSS